MILWQNKAKKLNSDLQSKWVEMLLQKQIRLKEACDGINNIASLKKYFFLIAALMDNWMQNPANVMYCYDTPDTISVFRTVC